jgi:hypothetical protein
MDAEEPLPPSREAAWSQAVRDLRATFEAHIGSGELADRFAVPEDYALFMQALGGAWKCDRGWGRIFAAHEVARITAQSCKNCAKDRRAGDGLWLDIGWWGSKNYYYLCCDRNHSLFGVVVEGEDAHPWLNSYEAMWFLAPTFLGFLRDYLPGRTSRPSKLGPPLPAKEWLQKVPAAASE